MALRAALHAVHMLQCSTAGLPVPSDGPPQQSNLNNRGLPPLGLGTATESTFIVVWLIYAARAGPCKQ